VPAPTRLVDIIIPVYGGVTETLACLQSVRANCPPNARIVVVDDASPEPALVQHLDGLAAQGQIQLLRHATNKGFVGAVNAGMALHPTRDVVLLNSDTVVFGAWLQRLRWAAYAAAAVGTVTPWSNAGSVASYPSVAEQSVTVPQAQALDTAAARLHAGRRAALPVGVGFCLYIRRDCLEATGAFDEAVFGLGYGEETDFCLRARALGYTHSLAADVYVYHAGGLSFAGKRGALLARSQRLVELRHPGYDRSIQQFLKQDPLQSLRRSLDEQRLLANDVRTVLLVSHALSGGVQRFVEERARTLQAQGMRALLLRAAAPGDRRRVQLLEVEGSAGDLVYQLPQDLDPLLQLLARLRPEHLELHHFLHLDPQLIDRLLALGVPCDVQVHDYALICPQITLIGPTGRYCGEPDASGCARCVRTLGTNLDESIAVPALRARSLRWLRQARRITVPSRDTAARLGKYFPGCTFTVQPHATPPQITPRALPPAARASGGRPTRVALIGAIGDHKGYQVLLACARDARRRKLPLEFVVVGYTQDDVALERTGRVFVTGRYSEGEAVHLLGREAADLIFLPSVWPETWCYALDEALASGRPVVSFDIGAIAERLRDAHTGFLLPLNAQAPAINDFLLGQARTADRPASLANPDPKVDELLMQQPKDPSGLSATVQLLPLPAGLYLFSVESGRPGRIAGTGSLTVPALHVGTGPGVSAQQAQFMPRDEHSGGWLFAPGDFLVVRLSAQTTPLLVTSVRDAGGATLSIKAERLDARFESQPAVAAAGTATPAAMPGKQAQLPLEMNLHIQNRGDVTFNRTEWAGRVDPGLWIESFTVTPLAGLTAEDIEYKGLTSSGFETPWISGGKPCGTRNLAVPLVGFAVRPKEGSNAAAYECQYTGFFRSGALVGPLKNGAPCRSTVANDPLEGIQLHILPRSTARKATAKAAPPAARGKAAAGRRSGSPARSAALRGGKRR
jgi:GT2 family glycosyltransferase/glycosyltransferase involved in cell wall biosynthesis